MDFVPSLVRITGTQEKDGLVSLIKDLLDGNLVFFNSGIGLHQNLAPAEISFTTTGKFSDQYFRIGQRFNPTKLHLPPGTLSEDPHCHPGGEFAYVQGGSYFDADMKGNPIQTYMKGTTVFYGKNSTHRPLSATGADIIYIPFDGIIFGKNPRELLSKMTRMPISEESVDYALRWMVPEENERKLILESLPMQNRSK